MPGGGLTAIGLAGLVVSYSGIAHTFIDGMHALTGLLFMFGLIIMAAGILEGGISTTNRTKATALAVISIVLGFATFATTMTENSTLPLFAGMLIMISIPAIVISYFAMKMPTYAKPVGVIFIIAFGTGIGLWIAFGYVSPEQYLVTTDIAEVEEVVVIEEVIPEGPLDPDEARISQGHIIEWVNEDDVPHTATSSVDFGETFDSGMIMSGESYKLDTNKLDLGTYEYLCIVHPWMVSTIIIEESTE